MRTGALLIRADANHRIGAGHVMRCLALAQAWQSSGGNAIFAIHHCPASLKRRIHRIGLEVLDISADPATEEDAILLCKAAQQFSTNWIVVDGEHFGTAYQTVLKRAGFQVLSITDDASTHQQVTDVLLNQNVGAARALYPHCGRETRFLLGTRFVLLRREFAAWRNWKRKITRDAHNVLVTMGGADPKNLTEQVTHALIQARIPGLNVTVVAGLHHAIPEGTLGSADHCRMRVVHNVSDMPRLIAWADVTVIAAGGTLWELLYMQTPVISYTVRDAQDGPVRDLEKVGAICNLGRSPVKEEMLCDVLTQLLGDQHRRERMGNLGRTIVDGRGARRVVEALQECPEVIRDGFDSGELQGDYAERAAGRSSRVHANG